MNVNLHDQGSSGTSGRTQPRRAAALTIAACLTMAISACRSSHQFESFANTRIAERRAVDAVPNSLHDAAAKADGERYFSLFAREAIFYGTDDAERWTVEQFRAYAEPYFSQGQGWTYTVADRHTYFDASGRTAWFDERLDNAKWGRCRGSGVLIHREGRWQIAQYNLTVPIPNDLLPNVAEQIRVFEMNKPR